MRSDSSQSPYDLGGLDLRTRSPAFRKFVLNFFEDTRALGRRELDVAFLQDLTADEVLEARHLLLRNLDLRYISLIEGLGLLGNPADAPKLQQLLATEPDFSRRLTIGRALWRINRDPQFPKLLEQMVASEDEILKQAHIDDIPLLGDERAIALLILLLNDDDSFVRHLALSQLNDLEFSARYLTSSFPHDAAYYRARRSDPVFIARLVSNLAADQRHWPVYT